MHKAYNVERAIRLAAVELERKVIVVQLGVWVSGGGGAERQGNVGGPQGVEEDALPKGAVAVVEGFVDNVPGVAGAGIVADDVGNVCFNDGGQGYRGP